jgi:hypothetical protein
MDCEKFEDTMLDELYGELDELTLAASRRHAGGCARCSALIAGLRATRKLVTLPVLSPSEGFESRLLSAVHDAERRPKLGVAQVISIAGQWAMRPQTAMAAMLLLMIGTTSSVFLTRRGHQAAVAASSSFTVTERGSPEAAFAAAPSPATQSAEMDPNAAAAAHGVAPAASAAPALAAPKSQAFADNADLDEKERSFQAKKAPSRPMAGASPESASGGGGGSLGSLGRASNAPSDYGGFAPPPPAAPVATAAAPGAGALKDDGAFGAANQQLRQGDYHGAANSFDAIAATGDTTAGLMAARSVRDGAGGCQAAVLRFDQVAQTAWGSPAGYDATLDGARCYAQLGQADAARSRYQRLLTVPAYAARAQSGIAALTPMAVAAKRMAKPVAAQELAPATAPPAAAAPQAAPPAAPKKSAPSL